MELESAGRKHEHEEEASVPSRWDVRPLGDIGSVTAGGTPHRSNPNYWHGEIPWVTTSEVDFRTITETRQTITREGLLNSAAHLLPAGTILMALYGQGKTRGKVAVLGIPAATNQACAAISLKHEISRDFVFYFLANKYEAIRNLSNTGNQENLTGSIVRSIPILLPPPPEQAVIAEALREIDALLNALIDLIAKKRGLKRAAMQQLLSGRSRLPGFRRDWRSVHLGDVGRFSKGRGIRRDEVTSEGYPCVRYGEIYTHHTDHIREFFSFIPADVAKNSHQLQSGDLLFAGSGETAEEIGKCVAFLGGCEAYAGSDIVIMTPVTQDSRFLGYLMNHASVAEQKARMGQGDAVVHISAANLARIRVRLPEPTEQAAIADVLWDMDGEIEALEQRLAKIRALKQGMMQALLTGRVRLLPAEAAVAASI